MRHCATLAGAALATVGFALADPGCCSISDPSKLETDSDVPAKDEPVVISGTSNARSVASLDAGQSEPSDPAAVNDFAKDGSEKPGDLLRPDSSASKGSAGPDSGFGNGQSLVAGSDESLLTRVVAILTRLGGVVAPTR
jgi:hypothetical protein